MAAPTLPQDQADVIAKATQTSNEDVKKGFEQFLVSMFFSISFTSRPCHICMKYLFKFVKIKFLKYRKNTPLVKLTKMASESSAA
jgi:hypothetical protein